MHPVVCWVGRRFIVADGHLMPAKLQGKVELRSVTTEEHTHRSSPSSGPLVSCLKLPLPLVLRSQQRPPSTLKDSQQLRNPGENRNLSKSICWCPEPEAVRNV